jgi:hypothetical protein
MSVSHSGSHPPPANGGVETEYDESLGPGKGIYATIGEDGFVEFKINTAGTGVRGTDLFHRMMRAFGGRVRGIWGMWSTGTNLDITMANKIITNQSPAAYWTQGCWK